MFSVPIPGSNECVMCAAGQDWQAGKVSGTVYSGDEKLTQIMAKVGLAFSVCPHGLLQIPRESHSVCVRVLLWFFSGMCVFHMPIK